MNEVEYLDKSLLVEGTEIESVPSTDFMDSETAEFEDNTIELHEMVGTTGECTVDSTTSGKQGDSPLPLSAVIITIAAIVTVILIRKLR